MTTEANTFEALGLINELLSALSKEGYTEPTPIQSQAIPHILKKSDLLACAQTGTGKTAAFALPILQLLAENIVPSAEKKIRVLVLTPTRELAAQIGESFKTYGNNLEIYGTVVFGGVGSGSQITAARRGLDILVATPGRLLDLIEQRHISLKDVEIFVLDEADRMLDMGFIHDVKRVIKLLPSRRQNLLFSATMPIDIVKLADHILVNPVRVEVTPAATTAEKIDQRVYFVDGLNTKRELLKHVLEDESVARALVFTRTKHGADRVARFLNGVGITAEAIHGNKSQNNRVRALDSFKAGETRILVATDIAARGLDIDGVTHVINFEIPNVPETYVHRIGRTARAGAEGVSYSFCDREELDFLKDIEKLTRQKIRVIGDHPFVPGTFVPSVRTTPERNERPRSQQQRAARNPVGRSAGPRTHSTGARPQSSRSASQRRTGRQTQDRNVPRSSPRPGAGSQGSRSRGESPVGSRSHAPVAASKPAASAKVSVASDAKKKPWWKRLLIDDE